MDVKIPLLPFLAKSYKQLIMLLIYPNQATSLQGHGQTSIHGGITLSMMIIRCPVISLWWMFLLRLNQFGLS